MENSPQFVEAKLTQHGAVVELYVEHNNIIIVFTCTPPSNKLIW